LYWPDLLTLTIFSPVVPDRHDFNLFVAVFINQSHFFV